VTICKWHASITVVVAMLSVAQAETHCPGNVASLRVRFIERTQIVVPVEINHKGPYDFLVDTGAQVTTIDPALVSQVSLKIVGTTGVSGFGISGPANYTELDLLNAGQHSVKNALALVQDLQPLQRLDPQVRGILGDNFLEHFDLLIDYAHSILCLDDTKQMRARVHGEHIALVRPAYTERDLPFTQPLVVSAKLAGAAGLRLRLDSGSNAPVLYTATDISRHGTLLKRVVAGQQQSFAVLPPQELRLGQHSWQRVSFIVPLHPGMSAAGEDGVLPTALFQRIYISYSDQYVVFE
jgi:hypothetical protein